MGHQGETLLETVAVIQQRMEGNHYTDTILCLLMYTYTKLNSDLFYLNVCLCF